MADTATVGGTRVGTDSQKSVGAYLAQKSEDAFNSLVTKTTSSLRSISESDDRTILSALQFFMKGERLSATDCALICHSPYGTDMQKNALLKLANSALEKIHDFLGQTSVDILVRQSIMPAKIEIFHLSNSLKRALAPKQPNT